MKNNKLIAEFMGFQKTTMGWYDNEEAMNFNSDSNTFDELKFHSSWDWLMPIVSKIRIVADSEDSAWEEIYYSFDLCDINITYQAVVEFIKRTKKGTEQHGA